MAAADGSTRPCKSFTEKQLRTWYAQSTAERIAVEVDPHRMIGKWRHLDIANVI